MKTRYYPTLISRTSCSSKTLNTGSIISSYSGKDSTNNYSQSTTGCKDIMSYAAAITLMSQT
jgi:hypothetical protein